MEGFILQVYFFAALFMTLATLGVACKQKEKFSDLGDRVASPIDVATDKNGQYFYALNSDFSRDYNAGSLLVLDTQGQKLGVAPLPRLGRSLTVAGDTLIITFSDSGDNGAQVMLFDLTKPDKPESAKTFDMGACDPINAMAKASYAYWAVSCANGKIFAGELKSPLSSSSLQMVRNYDIPRRALHIDTARNLLFAFPTDLGEKQTWRDAQLVDSVSYSDEDGTKTDTPNEIPDYYEDSRTKRANKTIRGIYQFAIYDLAAGAASGWQAKELKDAYSELRWNYFSLANSDGTPDVAVTTANINERLYRTNFWDAKPDPEDDDVFYLSQRGIAESVRPGSQYANNVVKVRITGDVTASNVWTSDVMSFERVYGFKGELEPNGRHYPSGFDLKVVRGKPLLVVNHFRNPVTWPGQTYFSVAAKVVGENYWFAETSSTSTAKSYYQVALTPSGRAIAANFYGNSLILLDVTPGVGITEVASNIQ